MRVRAIDSKALQPEGPKLPPAPPRYGVATFNVHDLTGQRVASVVFLGGDVDELHEERLSRYADMLAIYERGHRTGTEQATQKIRDAVLELHKRTTTDEGGVPFCSCCITQKWPCATVRAVS